jgi:transcriptional regulator with XRE-family HTH domain
MVQGKTMLIQKLRLQRGWSQEQLAELSGLSVRTIQRLERGQPASTESLKAIGSVFEIDFSQLKEPTMDTPNTAATPRDLATDEALALAHVRRVKRFYMHALQYVGIVGALTVINLVTSPQYLWVIWVAFGWGLGVIFDGLRVFGSLPFLNGAWERREVEKYLGREL